MLLPGKKKAISQVNALLCEVKLMACLDHPRIVTFIGVAWDQLVDICVVRRTACNILIVEDGSIVAYVIHCLWGRMSTMSGPMCT